MTENQVPGWAHGYTITRFSDASLGLRCDWCKHPISRDLVPGRDLEELFVAARDHDQVCRNKHGGGYPGSGQVKSMQPPAPVPSASAASAPPPFVVRALGALDTLTAALAREGRPTERDRIGAVLALVDEAIAANPDEESTHYENCHHDHAPCLAHRIRAILKGEGNG